MSEPILYCFMASTVFFVILGIIHLAEQHKSYIASADSGIKPQREASKPFRSKRAQEIWNRLNPRFYMDDDETELMPDKVRREKVKQR